jgi:TnpA family transposase
MLRVGVSIAAGTIMPSTILRGLDTDCCKNRLYLAFPELGVAVRTGFLHQFLGDAQLRSTIQSATNKSESFNDFVKWQAFGGGCVIAENNRSEQRKIKSQPIVNRVPFEFSTGLDPVVPATVIQGAKGDWLAIRGGAAA